MRGTHVIVICSISTSMFHYLFVLVLKKINSFYLYIFKKMCCTVLYTYLLLVPGYQYQVKMYV